MSTFNETNQVRNALKMKLSQHCWYNGSVVVSEADGYSILIAVKQIDNAVRKTIPPVVDGVEVRFHEGK